LGEETKALCGMHPAHPPPPARTVFPAQKLHCEPGPSNQGGWHRVGGGPKEWPWVQSGRGAGQGSPAGPRTSLVSSGLPPMSVLQRCGGAGGQLRSPLDHGQDLVIRCWLCIWAVPGRCPEPRQGPEPVAGHSHFDFIVLLSISKLEGVCLHCAGHRGPAACLGCTPLFIQALPRSPSLGQHPPQLLAPGIYPSVVAAALVVPPACSPVPARGHVSRCTGILFHWAGPHLSHWAQLSGYPIGVVSTGLGA